MNGARLSPWISRIVWLFALASLITIVLKPELYQWDFRVLYSAALTTNLGLDPYDNATRNAVMLVPSMEFFYPPFTLYFLRPFTAVPYEIAHILWLALKLAAFALTALIWHRKFEPLNARFPIVLYFLFAYSSTLYRDFAAGNITIFEQLVLWLGFGFFIGRRYLLFGLCIAFIAQFKLQPVVFLGLLLIVERRPQWRALMGSVAAFVGMVGLDFLLQPSLMAGFVARMVRGGDNLYEVGSINPSLLAIIRESISLVADRVVALPAHVDLLAYGVAVLGILAIVLSVFVRYRNGHPDYDRRLLVYLGCFLFCVTAARMKDYGYVLCLLPTLAILRRRRDDFLIPFAAAFVLAPSLTTYAPYFDRVTGIFYAYLPLLTAGVMLWLCLDELKRPSGKSRDSISSEVP